MTFKNIALIVAAGNGQRMQSSIPKQYITINGLPIIHHTLKRFCDNSYIDKVVCVIAPEHKDMFERTTHGLAVDYCYGGDNRAESVKKGLDYVAKFGPEYILVHDSVRPNFSSKLIINLLEAVKEYNAVIPCLAVTSTMKEVRDNKIYQTVERKKIFEAQTPQVFNYDLLVKAYENITNLIEATDDAFIVEQYGAPIYTIPGEKHNMKVTTQEDITFQEFLIKRDKEKCFV